MAEKKKEIPGKAPLPEMEPASVPVSPEKLAEQRARAEALGLIRPPHVERALNRPSPPVVAPTFAQSGELEEVTVRKALSWCPGGGSIGVHFPEGTRVRAGVEVAGKVIDQADLQSLVDAGYAEVEPVATVRYLRRSDVLIGDRVHSSPYGKLFTLPKRLAEILCRRGSPFLDPSAELICEGRFAGDLSTLPPCPPPSRYHGEPPRVDGPDAYCRFRWTSPPVKGGIAPGAIEWIDERQAVDYSLQGRGEIVLASELSPKGREYLAAQSAKPRVPLGRMFAVKDGSILS